MNGFLCGRSGTFSKTLNQDLKRIVTNQCLNWRFLNSEEKPKSQMKRIRLFSMWRVFPLSGMC